MFRVEKDLIYFDGVKETKLKRLFVRLAKKKGFYNHAIKTKTRLHVRKQKGH